MSREEGVRVAPVGGMYGVAVSMLNTPAVVTHNALEVGGAGSVEVRTMISHAEFLALLDAHGEGGESVQGGGKRKGRKRKRLGVAGDDVVPGVVGAKQGVAFAAGEGSGGQRGGGKGGGKGGGESVFLMAAGSPRTSGGYAGCVWGPPGSDGMRGCALAVFDQGGRGGILVWGEQGWKLVASLSHLVHSYLSHRHASSSTSSSSSLGGKGKGRQKRLDGSAAQTGSQAWPKGRVSPMAVGALAWSRMFVDESNKEYSFLVLGGGVDVFVVACSYDHTEGGNPLFRVATSRTLPIGGEIRCLDIVLKGNLLVVALGTSQGFLAALTLSVSMEAAGPDSEIIRISFMSLFPLYAGSLFIGIDAVSFTQRDSSEASSSDYLPALAFASGNTIGVWDSVLHRDERIVCAEGVQGVGVTNPFSGGGEGKTVVRTRSVDAPCIVAGLAWGGDDVLFVLLRNGRLIRYTRELAIEADAGVPHLSASKVYVGFAVSANGLLGFWGATSDEAIVAAIPTWPKPKRKHKRKATDLALTTSLGGPPEVLEIVVLNTDLSSVLRQVVSRVKDLPSASLWDVVSVLTSFQERSGSEVDVASAFETVLTQVQDQGGGGGGEGGSAASALARGRLNAIRKTVYLLRKFTTSASMEGVPKVEVLEAEAESLLCHVGLSNGGTSDVRAWAMAQKVLASECPYQDTIDLATQTVERLEGLTDEELGQTCPFCQISTRGTMGEICDNGHPLTRCGESNAVLGVGCDPAVCPVCERRIGHGFVCPLCDVRLK